MDAARSLARRHALLLVLVAVGVALRALTAVAYPPALFFGDSWGYVVSAFAGHPVALSNVRPSGYPALIALFGGPAHDVAAVVLVQHLAGLVTAVLVYAALVVARLPRIAAAAAAALVLLDGYAVVLEQHLMPEAFFTLTLVTALLVLAWPALARATDPPGRRAGTAVSALAGLLLAAATLQRTAALFVLPVVAVYLLWARPGIRPVAALAVAVALPILVYSAAERARFGTFGLTQTSGWIQYGRVAGFADCAKLGVRPGERVLCEDGAQRRSHPTAPTWYIFSPLSPAVRAFGGESAPPPQLARSDAILSGFARRAVRHQFGDYAGAVVTDVAHAFEPGATAFGDEVSATAVPRTAAEEPVVEAVRARYLPDVHPDVRSPAAAVRAYRSVVHLPRPVLALLALAAVAAVVLRSPARREILLLAGSGLALIVGSAATAGFGLRYVLPAVPLLAIGGVLAARDLWARYGRRSAGASRRSSGSSGGVEGSYV